MSFCRIKIKRLAQKPERKISENNSTNKCGFVVYSAGFSVNPEEYRALFFALFILNRFFTFITVTESRISE